MQQRLRTGELSQQLRALSVLVEDPGPIPSIHVVAPSLGIHNSEFHPVYLNFLSVCLSSCYRVSLCSPGCSLTQTLLPVPPNAEIKGFVTTFSL